MPLPAWPNHVPYLQRRQDWQIPQPFIGPIETEMEGGNVRLRSRPGSNVATLQWRRRMTTLQYTSFDAFVRSTLSNGTSRFIMPVWLGASYVVKTVQIAKDSLSVSQDGLFVAVSMTLRVHGVWSVPQGTAAWEEAEASVPASVQVYFTLELQHPGFVDESTSPIPIRCVTGVYEDMQLGIEDGAVFDAGQMATFAAIPFHADFPEFAEGTVPQTRIVVDNVSRELVPHIDSAVQLRADLIAIYREYRSDDVSAPCFGPVEFIVRQVSMTGTRIEGMASIDDLANKKFPSRVYTTKEYPGLQS